MRVSAPCLRAWLLLLPQLLRPHGARLAPDLAELQSACYFTYALRLDLPGSDHHTIRAPDFQRKAADFYAGLPVPAPLEEAYWILTLPEDFQEVVVKECPAMAVLSYLLVAETKVYVDPEHASEYAEIGLGILRRQDARLVDMLGESWPLAQALQRLEASRLAVRALQAAWPAGPSVDFVVAHCREDLGWLRELLPRWAPPGAARLFLYEKCGERGDVGPMVPTVSIAVDDAGPGGRKDECSAYLTHLAQAARGEAAQYTVFLQADALHHARPQLLDLVFRAIRHRALDVPFLHLSHAAMVSSSSPCKRAIFEQLVGRPPEAAPRSYCCAQFLARRDTLLQRGAEAWGRALAAMDAPLPAGCERVRPAAGMHCLALESMWHVLFGQPERLPARAQDLGLPAFLRLPESDASDLPGGDRTEVYLSHAAGDSEAAERLAALEPKGVDVTGARSIGYVAAAPRP